MLPPPGPVELVWGFPLVTLPGITRVARTKRGNKDYSGSRNARVGHHGFARLVAPVGPADSSLIEEICRC